MGDNMESLLMGGDDSSSGESDAEELSKVPASTSAVAATVQPTASPTPPQQQAAPPAAAPAPVPAPTPAPAPPPAAAAQAPAAAAASQPPPKSQSEMNRRLASLYKSPGNSGKGKQLPAQPPAAAPAPPPQQSAAQQAPAPTRPPAHSTSTSGRSPHHPGAPQPVQRQASQSGSRPPTGLPRGTSSGIKHGQQQPGYSSSPGQPASAQRYSSSSAQSQQQSSSQYPSQPSYRSSSSQHGRPPSQGQQSQQPPVMQRSATGGSSVPNPVPHGSVPQPGQRRGNVSSHDPFEPTPLHKIKEREQKAAAAAQAAQRAGYSSQSGTSASHATAPASNTSSSVTEREKEMRRQKERFLMFTRVLMKYLETKDPALHQKVKAIIKDCAERNKRQERGYESVTASMRERLKHVVGDQYWKRAESYLAHFLAQKQKQSGGSSSGKPTSGGSSQDANRMAAEQKRKLELERQKRHQLQQQKMQQAKMQQQQQAAAAAQQQQQQAQQQQPSQAAPTTQQPPTGAPTAVTKARTQSVSGKGKRPAGGGKQAGGKTTKKVRKTSTTTTVKGAKSPGQPTTVPVTTQTQVPAPTMPTTPMAVEPARPPSPPPVREWSELMEMVDHAVNFDWTTAGLIMGSSIQKELLQEEQKNLLYGDMGLSSKLASAVAPGANELSTDNNNDDTAKTPGGVPFALRGWGKRNLVSPRVAWSRIRRREQPSKEALARYKALYPEAPPVPTSPTAWVHEEKAEDDPTLCLLSEATQIYIKQVLQNALVCARQRHNLDGIRLWHQQCTAYVEAAKAEADGKEKPEPPPLSIRLGADVSRQVARHMGNAALISKRMEEALERRDLREATRVVPAKKVFSMDYDVIRSANSMGELSLLPPLARGSESADYEAKRCFEIYGGKHAREPPFGRVPKNPKIEIIDFQNGMQLNNFAIGGQAARRSRANPNSFRFTMDRKSAFFI